ncbi:dTMP kinase [Campylobacter corcagiensis]|uniref:Thymidylate kinase n=1 Tax=Campylobacter corcagiensis TaxID=1448857 RepID=A0A7M1LEZ7_9BACT|nr:dTMP kinase [Campylobacter corcagiensis]QKF64708.1 dTMP kinase [Campylobacter corcagiensis]QOQ87128.1 dTMP kinase [Campylobacter corcagiensis]
MLVTFEGIDGVGKSTQIELLKKAYPDAIITKEPGGTEFGKKIRQIVLNGSDISFRAEILLFLADRAQHYEKVIAPNSKNLILSDRGFISGMAYAMANEPNLDIEELLMFNKFALKGNFGDKFIFFKIDKDTLISRLSTREKDSIEARGMEYLLRVQDYMEMILKNLKFKVLTVKADDEILAINEKIKEFIK